MKLMFDKFQKDNQVGYSIFFLTASPISIVSREQTVSMTQYPANSMPIVFQNPKL